MKKHLYIITLAWVCCLVGECTERVGGGMLFGAAMFTLAYATGYCLIKY